MVTALNRNIARKLQISEEIIDMVGQTPLTYIGELEDCPEDVRIYAKLEMVNPGGSVKDRPALNMIQKAIERGELSHDKTIIDATSGNTGIAYATIGVALGYYVKLVVPANVSASRKKIMNSLGAEIVYTDPMEGIDGAIVKVREIVEKHPEKYYYPDQYNNPDNWKSHYETTAGEILERLDINDISAIVCGIGTGGTLMGLTRRFKELKSGIIAVSVEPDAPFHGLEGLKHMDSSIVPGIFDPSVLDERLYIKTELAQKYVKQLYNESKLSMGPSSGAALVGCLEIAKKIGSGTIVTVFPDGVEKYLHDPFLE